MSIQNIPRIFSFSNAPIQDFFVYDFKMTEDSVKNKVNLTLHMFSFLQTGEKKVQLGSHEVVVNNQQSVLIKSGNCLMTELLKKDKIYFCKLLFFSNQNLIDFLEKHHYPLENDEKKILENPFFLIENDDFIDSFVASISSILHLNLKTSTSLLAVKFEEIMLYLIQKYGSSFINYIQSLVFIDNQSYFKRIIETNINSNLNLQDIAFLANMSLSTFKRHFEQEFNTTPSKWFQHKRLEKAKLILEQGHKTPSEIYETYGYTSLSNFSIAFKKEFGFSPKHCQIKE